jgi:hypothetical protein
MCMPDHLKNVHCGPCHHGRTFFTKEEKIKHLEKYREQLQKEIQGIEEYLKEQK